MEEASYHKVYGKTFPKCDTIIQKFLWVFLPPTEAHKVAGSEAYSPNPPEIGQWLRGFAALTPGYPV